MGRQKTDMIEKVLADVAEVSSHGDNATLTIFLDNTSFVNLCNKIGAIEFKDEDKKLVTPKFVSVSDKDASIIIFPVRLISEQIVAIMEKEALEDSTYSVVIEKKEKDDGSTIH